jgi:hypothetical protein
LSLIPHRQTIARAVSVARSMSLEAPELISLNISSSAMRPPIARQIWSSICWR